MNGQDLYEGLRYVDPAMLEEAMEPVKRPKRRRYLPLAACLCLLLAGTAVAVFGHVEIRLLDVELSCGEERARRLIALAHGRGLGVVVSRHDFQKTPPQGEMVETLLRMKALGADLPKLAVMPQSPADVLAVLEATYEASAQIGPVITMAMGDLGKLSRVSGGLTGSCLTFGAGSSASAPGQLNAEDLRAILQDLDPWGTQKGM